MKYVKGDICDTMLEDIIHGCNAQGKMGSGVALAIRNRFEGCYESYVERLDEITDSGVNTHLAMGMDLVHFVKGVLAGPQRIHNLITQQYYGRDGKKYASYFHIMNGIRKIIEGNPSYYGRTRNVFAISKIGCSLGGLDWNVMEQILIDMEDELGAEFVVYYLE